MSKKLATFEEDSYELADGEERHSESPDSFEIPHKEIRDHIRKEEFVKLIFLSKSKSEQDKVLAERMWVKVKDKVNNLYSGIINNDPYPDSYLELGDEVVF